MRIVGDGDESFLLVFAELGLAVHQIAVGIGVLASDSSSQLMEARETELLRIDDDDRICREEIDPIFDDSRREEDIVFSFFECVDPVFYLVTCHLTMGNYYFWSIFSDTILHNTLDLLRESIHPSDPIVQDDDLSSSTHLMLDRMGDHTLVPSRDDGLYWFFLFRWSRDDRYFFQA